MKKSLPPMVFLAFFLFCLSGTIYAQKPIDDDQQILNAEKKLSEMQISSESGVKAQANQLEQLINGSNPTLLIFNGEFHLFGGDKPLVLDVQPQSLDLIYTDHPAYESIQLIRIKLEDLSDLNILLHLDQLSHLPSLTFVYFLVTFELCPEKPGDLDCQTGIINTLIDNSGQKSSIPVLYQVSLQM